MLNIIIMTDIERHIVELLLDNDCVIVPGFGGFMAHSMAASYDEKNHVFLPPSRTIGFNQRLTMNDSLLAQAYANCYDISYPEALRRIEQDVEMLKQMVETEDGHTICGVGRLTKADDGKIDFTPEASGIVSPVLYGFDAYEMELYVRSEEDTSTADEKKEQNDVLTDDQPVLSSRIFSSNDPLVLPVKETRKLEEEENERKEIALRIPISVVKHIAAACVVLFVLLSFPSKLGDASTSQLKHSSIDTSLLYEILPKEMTSGKPESLKEISTDQTSPNTAAAENQQSPAEEEIAMGENIKPCFSIVMASRITKSNATAYVKKLHAMGLTDARLYSTNKFTMVVYKQFATLAEAKAEKNKLIDKSEFKDCWIFEIK